MVIYLASDLLWATRIKATGEDVGVPCRPVRTIEMLEARLADSPVKALVVDLEAGPVAIEMIARLRGPGADDGNRAIRIVAFGPHVQRDALQAAQTAGADLVLTRGAFDQRLPEVLSKIGA